jgi:hypothetical protein
MAGFISERAAGFILECMAGFVGIRSNHFASAQVQFNTCVVGVEV